METQYSDIGEKDIIFTWLMWDLYFLNIVNEVIYNNYGLTMRR